MNQPGTGILPPGVFGSYVTITGASPKTEIVAIAFMGLVAWFLPYPAGERMLLVALILAITYNRNRFDRMIADLVQIPEAIRGA